MQIETDDRAADTDAPGALPRSQREERRGGQVAAVNPEMVLGKPDRGETEVLGRLGELQHLRKDLAGGSVGVPFHVVHQRKLHCHHPGAD